ncbi:ribonuclease PH [Planctopirus limnophila DSM 3776]|uniref:Ribonuclease PH n=1 Tax=Planctopirus limnophila (strain ATCC 43296 / DSM 3776 / IFAM 1008 / Mu 290) TaxID=521674 RepID=D5SR75_PLAL2|nr:ribonuclease PH [Planctopirus limnophila]ADG68568.1 ribonuclease PH [Planctopirus limnophila DSM 3776]
MRHDGRQPDELRPIRIQRQFTKVAPGSVLISAGDTTLLVTASIDETLPPWKAADPAAQKGWLTAEYCMLPGSTSPRKRREREKVDGRSTEIQRLIGRSLRACVDFETLGPRTIMIDVEVLQADGGTRTLGITGGYIALCDAIATLGDKVSKDRPVLTTSIAAVSVGISHGTPILDLDYIEDSQAEVDLNVVMTGSGEFIEIQGTAEGRSFTRAQLDQQLALAEKGIRQLMELQQAALKG